MGIEKFLRGRRSLVAISIVVALLFSVVASQLSFDAKCEEISNKVLRLHILANSDSEEDQALKLKVRDKLVTESGNLFAESDSLEETLCVCSSNMEKIEAVAQEVIKENGYEYEADAQIVNMAFATRHYDGITLPAGNYDALRVTIGKGEGKNWWCVVFPSICLPASENSGESSDEKLAKALDEDEKEIVKSYDKYEFKFKILEWLKGE